MFGSGRWCHVKLSVKNFVPVAIVGQLAVVVIREDDLTLRNTLSKSRHNGTYFSTSHYVGCSNPILLSSGN